MTRVIFVSNRLPVTLHPDKQAPHDVVPSSGGLVSALKSVVEDYDEVLWIGWPGAHAEDEEAMTKRLHEASTSIQMHPVWLGKDDVEDFYNGFSNSSLWPLLHWMTPYARFRKSWFDSYRKVNQKFAETILSVARPTDIVWVHDYHLFLVPQMVRSLIEERYGNPDASPVRRHKEVSMDPRDMIKALKQGDSRRNSKEGKKVQFSATREGEEWHALKMAFFLHTPWPSWEVISTHPDVIDIVQGMLGADLIGFHTYNYLRHYRSCVIRLCGFTPQMDMVEFQGRRTRLGTYPIGANCGDILNNMKKESFKEHLQSYADEFQGKSLVLSVERLDYSKGMPQKLKAIERYLEQAEKTQKEKKMRQESGEHDDREVRLEQLRGRFEECWAEKKEQSRFGFKTAMTAFWNKAKEVMLEQEEKLDHTKTVFLFIAVPSRQTVQEYKAIEEEVHKQISEINGRFSTVNHTPIVYIHRGIPGDELAALYARADCCLVTPLVDGMNLIGKEFLVAKDREIENAVPGTVVLSEFAGATQEMFDALVVNPYDVQATADAIHLGLELTKGMGVDKQLSWEVSERMRTAVLENDAVFWANDVLKDLRDDPTIGRCHEPTKGPTSMLGVFTKDFSSDRDGKKAIFLNFDGSFQDSSFQLSQQVVHQLMELSGREDLFLCVVSGMTKEKVQENFGSFAKLTLVAEHGVFCRKSGKSEWKEALFDDSENWVEKVHSLMQLFQRGTPNAKLDVRQASVTWSYADCDEMYGTFKTKELVHQLALSTGNLPCEVCQGDKVIEVKSLRVSNGFAIKKLLADQDKTGQPFSSVMVISDDTTDNSAFKSFDKHQAYTVRVGLGETAARHRFLNWEEAEQYLNIIVDDDPLGLERSTSSLMERFQTAMSDHNEEEESKDRTLADASPEKVVEVMALRGA